MKKPSKLTEKKLKQFEKEAEYAKYLNKKIEELQEKLSKIESENRWTNYTSEEFYEGLTEEQKDRFAEANEIIKYGM